MPKNDGKLKANQLSKLKEAMGTTDHENQEESTVTITTNTDLEKTGQAPEGGTDDPTALPALERLKHGWKPNV